VQNFFRKVKVPNNQKCYPRLVVFNSSVTSHKTLAVCVLPLGPDCDTYFRPAAAKRSEQLELD